MQVADNMMYLINALAFDAKREEEYEKKNIYDHAFTSWSGETYDVTMMSSTESWYLDDGSAVGCGAGGRLLCDVGPSLRLYDPGQCHRAAGVYRGGDGYSGVNDNGICNTLLISARFTDRG